MYSNRGESPQDRVLEGRASREAQFRIAGVEPHGWSTILVEDQLGRFFIVTTASARLSEIPAADARALLAHRDYRVWCGARDWAPLERLPLVTFAPRQPIAPAGAPEPEAVYP